MGNFQEREAYVDVVIVFFCLEMKDSEGKRAKGRKPINEKLIGKVE